jgi:hypothetical protein
MKIISALFLLLVFTTGITQSLDDGLLLYYYFDGNTIDSSENHYHGISNATFTEDRFGNPNSAIHFNGYDQYLDFPPNKPILKPQLPVSFAFWILFEDEAPFVTQIFTTDFDQNNHSGTWVSNTHYGALSCGYGDGSDWCSIDTRRSKYCYTILNSNTWYFVIVIIRDALDMSVYLNCTEEDGYYEGNGGPLAYTDCQGSLGRKDAMATFPPDYFWGAMDDFRYWNRELTSNEIDSLCTYTSSVSNFCVPKNNLLIYPNPAKENILLYNIPTETAQIEIIDSFGKKIKTVLKTDQISISELNQGIYLLKFLSKQNRILSMNQFVKD